MQFSILRICPSKYMCCLYLGVFYYSLRDTLYHEGARISDLVIYQGISRIPQNVSFQSRITQSRCWDFIHQPFSIKIDSCSYRNPSIKYPLELSILSINSRQDLWLLTFTYDLLKGVVLTALPFTPLFHHILLLLSLLLLLFLFLLLLLLLLLLLHVSKVNKKHKEIVLLVHIVFIATCISICRVIQQLSFSQMKSYDQFLQIFSHSSGIMYDVTLQAFFIKSKLQSRDWMAPT